jgi:hypothetical protein
MYGLPLKGGAELFSSMELVVLAKPRFLSDLLRKIQKGG